MTWPWFWTWSDLVLILGGWALLTFLIVIVSAVLDWFAERTPAAKP